MNYTTKPKAKMTTPEIKTFEFRDSTCTDEIAATSLHSAIIDYTERYDTGDMDAGEKVKVKILFDDDYIGTLTIVADGHQGVDYYSLKQL
jgi:hypothetical protein